jgi:1-aminocyclopropane-1-carboxylate deaminase/D-cysteine desulfhydrase-like pyridoxal-dependent ACC family enzyme
MAWYGIEWNGPFSNLTMLIVRQTTLQQSISPLKSLSFTLYVKRQAKKNFTVSGNKE